MQGSEHFLGVSWLGITFGFGAQYGTHGEGLEDRFFFGNCARCCQGELLRHPSAPCLWELPRCAA